MKSKKVISCLMALTIVGGSSFLAFKTPVKALATNRIATSYSDKYSNKLSPAISKNGVIYWSKIKGADEYQYVLTKDNKKITDARCSSKATSDNVYDLDLGVGKYLLTIAAYDENENIIEDTESNIIFYYDGFRYKQIYN